MKQICFGTLFKLLQQAKKSNKTTNPVLCNAIFSAFGDSLDNYGADLHHWISGHDNLPTDFIKRVESLSFDQSSKGVVENIIPLIKEEKIKSIIAAIKTILKEDDTISADTIIGYDGNDGFKKECIVTGSTFNFENLISSVFYYAITKVNNKDCKGANKKVDNDYLSTLDDLTDNIFLDYSKKVLEMPLKSTLNDSTFDRVFKKIHRLEVDDLPSSTTVEIYSVDIANMNFNYKSLKDYILDNISSYVMSRTRIIDAKNDQKLMSIGAKAMRKYSQTFNKSQETILGETLLYIFIEQVLEAPKIMSKIELDESGKSRSDGIYLLHSSLNGVPFTQLVFGVSDILDNLKLAVDSVFNKISLISKHNEDELIVVDQTLYSNVFEPDVSNFIKNIIKPQRNNSIDTETAFGCFLGYTLSIDKTKYTKQEYVEAVNNQLKIDIENIKPYIRELIRKNNLNGYNLYFYVLPFNDADSEKISIVKEIVGGE